MPSVGRKFLLAGRGGLNLTHSEELAQFLTRYGDIAPLLRRAIEAFPPAALRAWCEGLGQPTFVGSSGRVFPTAHEGLAPAARLAAPARRTQGRRSRRAMTGSAGTTPESCASRMAGKRFSSRPT